MSSQFGNKRLAILSFHKIGEPTTGKGKTWFYISEDIFTGYLRYMKENDWAVIDYSLFIRALTLPDELPERSVLITFDDGYRSMREIVLPLLLRFEYPGVLFIPTKFIGGNNDFDIGVEPKEPICSWDDLAELERNGISVQSHGVSHRQFSELDLPQREEELYRSKVILEEKLGRAVEIFAYPYGDEGPDPQENTDLLKRIGYLAGCLYGGGPISLPIVQPFRLTRLAMGPDTNLEKALMGIDYIPLT